MGLKYAMALEESVEEHDVIEEVEGLRFIYNSGIAEYMDGLEISYEENLLRKGFNLYRESGGRC